MVVGAESRSHVVSMLVTDESDIAYVSEETLKADALATGRSVESLDSDVAEELIYSKLGTHMRSLASDQISVRYQQELFCLRFDLKCRTRRKSRSGYSMMLPRTWF